MIGIELRLLGDFELSDPDGRPITVPPRKARALLAYLGFHRGKLVGRDALSSLIWGDISAEEQARRSLRQSLTVLRRELPDGVLETSREGVSLRPIADVDVARFEHDALHADRSALERALALYRGELLQGFTARAAGFDAWLDRERRRLRAAATDALSRLCEIQRAEGDADAAMATAMRLIATDPVREAAHRTLMELYAEAGRTSEAVRQFNTLKTLLAEKLETPPDARTVELFERIRRSSERRSPSTDSPPVLADAGPELRQVCVVAVAPDDGRFDAALEQHVEVVLARFGGSLSSIGEGRALGLFGFPRAHDNDLERGVRAALSLCRLERLAHATVGVASGPLLVESLGGKPTLQGDVLGRAADLCRFDGPGVVVTGAVARTLGERLESRPADGELDARWVARLVNTAGLGGARTPLVGRRYELLQLSGALELCTQAGRGRTFIVRGEAGIGKTRLVRALCDMAVERGFAVHGRSVVDFGDAADEQPILGIVRELLAGEGGSATSRNVPDAGEAELEEADVALLLEMARENAPLDASPEPDGRALYLRRLRRATSKLLATRSSQQARLVWIDDVHWADPETLAQLGAWVDVAASHPVVLVMTTRLQGEPDERGFRAALRGRPVTTLDLAPLAPDEADALVRALDPADERSARDVLARAEGNPLFIEQLASSQRLDQVPASIFSLVQARSDRLAPEDRSALQAASVLGQFFTLSALSHLLEVERPPVAALLGESLISEDGDGYRFAHALIRDAVYDGMPRERLARLHASAARYYAGRDAALHARHLDQAGDPGACAAYVRAASAERRTGNLERALELCLRGRDLAERTRDRHVAALLSGELLIEVGRCEDALPAFTVAAASSSGPGERAQAHLGCAAALRVLDRSKEALLELAAAEQLVDPQRDPALVSRIHYLRGNVLFPLGDSAACLASHTLALEAARRTGSALAEAQALSGIADAHFAAGRIRSARTYFARCEELSRQIGSLELELTSSGMQHLLGIYDLSLREAAAGCHDVAERSRASGALRSEALNRLSAAWSLLVLGDWEAALAEARRSVVVAENIGAPRFTALAISYGAIARARLGQRKATEDELGRALSLARSSSMPFAGAAVYGALLCTADEERIPALLAEADGLIRSRAMNLALIVFIQNGIEAASKIGDSNRALQYVELLETVMRDEPHALGAIIAELGRTLATLQRDPAADDGPRRVEQLRARLERAGMRPALAFLDESAARARVQRRPRTDSALSTS